MSGSSHLLLYIICLPILQYGPSVPSGQVQLYTGIPSYSSVAQAPVLHRPSQLATTTICDGHWWNTILHFSSSMICNGYYLHVSSADYVPPVMWIHDAHILEKTDKYYRFVERRQRIRRCRMLRIFLLIYVFVKFVIILWWPKMINSRAGFQLQTHRIRIWLQYTMDRNYR